VGDFQSLKFVLNSTLEFATPFDGSERGKQGLSQVVLDLGGELLTRTGDIVERWQEHFKVP